MFCCHRIINFFFFVVTRIIIDIVCYYRIIINIAYISLSQNYQKWCIFVTTGIAINITAFLPLKGYHKITVFVLLQRLSYILHYLCHCKDYYDYCYFHSGTLNIKVNAMLLLQWLLYFFFSYSYYSLHQNHNISIITWIIVITVFLIRIITTIITINSIDIMTKINIVYIAIKITIINSLFTRIIMVIELGMASKCDIKLSYGLILL